MILSPGGIDRDPGPADFAAAVAGMIERGEFATFAHEGRSGPVLAAARSASPMAAAMTWAALSQAARARCATAYAKAGCQGDPSEFFGDDAEREHAVAILAELLSRDDADDLTPGPTIATAGDRAELALRNLTWEADQADHLTSPAERLAALASIGRRRGWIARRWQEVDGSADRNRAMLAEAGAEAIAAAGGVDAVADGLLAVRAARGTGPSPELAGLLVQIGEGEAAKARIEARGGAWGLDDIAARLDRLRAKADALRATEADHAETAARDLVADAASGGAGAMLVLAKELADVAEPKARELASALRAGHRAARAKLAGAWLAAVEIATAEGIGAVLPQVEPNRPAQRLADVVAGMKPGFRPPVGGVQHVNESATAGTVATQAWGGPLPYLELPAQFTARPQRLSDVMGEIGRRVSAGMASDRAEADSTVGGSGDDLHATQRAELATLRREMDAIAPTPRPHPAPSPRGSGDESRMRLEEQFRADPRFKDAPGVTYLLTRESTAASKALFDAWVSGDEGRIQAALEYRNRIMEGLRV